MPHSVLFRLMHHHPSKWVNNPRIDTLSKIVDFFKMDGFNVTVNDLLMGLEEVSEINIQKQKMASLVEVKLPLYSFNATHSEKIGMIPVKLTTNSKDVIGLLSDEGIQSLFQKGSLYIVDTKLKPENENLVAIKMEEHPKIVIRKFHIENDKQWLKSISDNTYSVILNFKLHSIIDVIIQMVGSKANCDKPGKLY